MKFLVTLMICLTGALGTFADGRENGGGNIYHGKPLESYIVDPTTLPSFQQTVGKFLTFDVDSNPGNYLQPDIGNPIRHILKTKNWYFVPGPLTQLPPEQIGSAVPADQLALQDFSSVWIDIDLFSKLSIEDQGKMILHEVLIGFKLLRLTSPFDACLAGGFVSNSYSCYPKSHEPAGSPGDLTKSDYEDVRRLVTLLMKEAPPPMDWKAWKKLFAIGHFGYSVFAFEFYETQELSPAELAQKVSSSLDTGLKLNFGYSIESLRQTLGPDWDPSQPVPNGTVWKATLPCQVELENLSNGFRLQIKIGSYQIDETEIFLQHNQSRLSYFQFINGDWNWNGSLYQQKVSNIAGARYDDMSVQFADKTGHLKMVTIEEYYIRAPGMHNSAFRELGGHYYVCSTKPEIRFQRDFSHTADW